MILRRKLEIALVVARNAENRAGAVVHEHKIGDVDRKLPGRIERVDRLERGSVALLLGGLDLGTFRFQSKVDQSGAAPGTYALAGVANLTLKDIASHPWILPPQGSILRHRVDMMFRRAGLEPPANTVDTTALLLITALLQQTDTLHVMPVDVARYYQSLNVLTILPIELPFKMDAFGIVQQQDHLLSPGANLLLTAVRSAAKEVY